MRYATASRGEYIYAGGIFQPSRTVLITVIDVATDSALALDDDACTESTVQPGLYVWSSANLTVQPTGLTHCIYVMEDQSSGQMHVDKFIIGGFPEESAIARFRGAVHIDVDNGVPGTTHPIGTPDTPVDNLADALVIAAANGLTTFVLRGSVTLVSALDNWRVIGRGGQAAVTLNGQSVDGTEFADVAVGGASNGASFITMAGGRAVSVSNLTGTFTDVGFEGTCSFVGSEEVNLVDCYSSEPSTTQPILNLILFSGDLNARHWSGALEIRNASGPNIDVDLQAGSVALDSTVLSGTIRVSGTGVLSDSSGGTAAVDSSGLVVGTEVRRLYGGVTRTQLYYASAAITGGREVPLGAVSHMQVEVGIDGSPPDFSSPQAYFVVFNYAAGDSAASPARSSSIQSSAPSDGSFTSDPFPPAS